MFNFEKRIIDIITKYFYIILFVCALILSIRMRKQGMHFISGDYSVYFLPWFTTLKENGGFKGLSLSFYEYYIPYMSLLAIGTYIDGLNVLTFIKKISILAEYACAFLGGAICLQALGFNQKHKAVVVVAVLSLSPMICLNGAYWAQCDYIYIAFILCSIFLLLQNYYSLSFIFLGIAFCFKFQTVFILPAFFLYYICTQKFSVLKFLWIPVMYLIGGLPAIIAGRPAVEVYRTYIGQASTDSHLSMNIPNLWSLFPEVSDDFSRWGISLTIIILFILALIVFQNQYQINSQVFLLICLCSCGICVITLPGMHERYVSIYVLLSYLYFLIYDRKKSFIPILQDLITCITYFFYLYNLDVQSWYPLLAIMHMGILYYIIIYTLQKLRDC